jgi:uncharacterized protein YwgA
MENGAQDRQAWLAAGIAELNRNDSWTGRIHTHKLFAVAELTNVVKPPFEFELYEYGPYSFELDREFSLAEIYGIVERTYPQAGYGPRYQLTEIGKQVASRLEESGRTALARTAKSLGAKNSKELELLATCLWVERREHESDDGVIVRRVLELKPKYSAFEVERALKEARIVATALSR